MQKSQAGGHEDVVERGRGSDLRLFDDVGLNSVYFGGRAIGDVLVTKPGSGGKNFAVA